jgi:hypothetical protein
MHLLWVYHTITVILPFHYRGFTIVYHEFTIMLIHHGFTMLLPLNYITVLSTWVYHTFPGKLTCILTYIYYCFTRIFS